MVLAGRRCILHRYRSSRISRSVLSHGESRRHRCVVQYEQIRVRKHLQQTGTVLQGMGPAEVLGPVSTCGRSARLIPARAAAFASANTDNFCRFRSDHPHNARCHADSVIVHYKFHRCPASTFRLSKRAKSLGETFSSCATPRGAAVTVRLDAAATYPLIKARATAVVTLAALRDLRRVVAGILSSFSKGHLDPGEVRAEAPIVNRQLDRLFTGKRGTRAAVPRRHAKPNTSAPTKTTARSDRGRTSRKGRRRWIELWSICRIAGVTSASPRLGN